uniref:CID domain-containing protein n=1 Tax=Globodera rostochiensis TaxID=31243 RepID=A0A914I879_GLORO
MSGFSDQLMRDRLQKLSNTAHSIQILSAWLLHHAKKHADSILDCWLKEVRNNSDNERLISLINLANDVIQNSRKKVPTFLTAFLEVLQPAFIHASECMDESHRRMIARIVSVWRDRQIYSAKQLDDLAKCLAVDDAAVSVSPNLNSETENPAKSSPADGGQSPVASEEDSKKIKEEFHAFSTLSSNMITLLRKLEDPASTDLKSMGELGELSNKIAEAMPVVDVYCGRLREELKDRQNFQFLIEDYIKALNEANERNKQLVVSVKRRIVRLDEEKRELARHIESLPDLAEMFGSESASTPHLPSLGELFTSTS